MNEILPPMKYRGQDDQSGKNSPTGHLDKLSEEFRNLIHLAREISALRNMPVYLVGGFVRDLILGVKNLDMDMVAEGDGIIFAEDLAARLNVRLVRHKRFGTATVAAGHHLKVDIATARKEVYLKPGQLPEVTFGSLKDDLKRRDFTINTMAIGISGQGLGRLIDFFNGEKDLRDKKIRVLHEMSFIDDPTRILRAVRFEQRFDFEIEPVTLKYLSKALRAKMLEKVQPQRLRDELILGLKEAQPLKLLKRIAQLKAFGFISSNLRFPKKKADLFDSVRAEIDWFSRQHSLRRKLDIWLIYFIALIDSISLKETETICRKFVFRNGDEKRILNFKRISSHFIRQLCSDKIKPDRIFSLLVPLSYEVIILLKAKYKNPLFRRHIEDFLGIYNDIRIWISGHDLHSMGILPGAQYQKIFSRVLKAKLNGLVKTKEEEIELIRRLK